MTKPILFFVTSLGLCYEVCGTTFRGSAQILQRPETKAEKFLLLNNNKNSLLQKGGGEEEDNATNVLLNLLGSRFSRQEAEASLEGLKKLAERNMWDTKSWVERFEKMKEPDIEHTVQTIQAIRAGPKRRKELKPPLSLDDHIPLINLLKVIDEERTSAMWSKKFDEGYFNSQEYQEQLSLQKQQRESSRSPPSFDDIIKWGAGKRARDSVVEKHL